MFFCISPLFPLFELIFFRFVDVVLFGGGVLDLFCLVFSCLLACWLFCWFSISLAYFANEPQDGIYLMQITDVTDQQTNEKTRPSTAAILLT